jgi:hypothetical protein
VEHRRELEQAEFDRALLDEIEQFGAMLRSKDFINSVESSTDFWLKHLEQFPILSQVAQVLLLIPSSSSFIERFFSVCGIITDKFTSMEDFLFQMRAMFRGNMETLEKI